MKHLKKAFTLSVAATILIIGIVYAIPQLLIQNTGIIETPANIECDSTHISWGTLYPGQQTSRQVNFRADAPVKLAYTISAWEPPTLSDYATVSWNYTGETVGAEWTPVTFTLHIHEDVPRSIAGFSFTIHITGETT